MTIPSSTTAGAGNRAAGGSILAAALALPGVAGAEGAPTDGLIGLKYLYYREIRDLGGTNLKPLDVSSPSVYALLPLGPQWSAEGSLTVDSLSGATPRWHSSVSSASSMSDNRVAGDLRVTRYFRRTTVGLAAAYSDENDYTSRALSADVRLSTEDNNTTFTVGFGYTDDDIKVNTEHPGSQSNLPRDALGNPVAQSKRTRDVMLGVTQVLTPTDIVQVNLTHARGRGFFTDPYKFNDNRPTLRDQTALLVRWNRHVRPLDATLRLSYRYYTDSFDVAANTVGAEWVQPYGSLTLTPELRYHTQSSARFYVDPIPGSPVPPTVSTDPAGFYSADFRLSAFGAVTAGLKVAWQVDRAWTVDAKASYYEQRGEWRIGGDGSPGLDPFRAQFYQVGLYRRF